ncbi:CbiX/SirB N-terminal domain-containing protein [Actinoplanes sp. NPDC026619]|uniref:sirohydrochlorin chelatase n=1 Tax=Actinoplanes sp. NPDC026619 TaxID=3155798 RepID=UPI0033E88BAE
MTSHRPTLLAVAHGTRSATGQQQVRDLVAAVARRRPELDVRLSYADVQQPRIGAVVPTVGDAVVVPLLLSAGYHVRVDIADAVVGTGFPVTAPLGPDPVLLESLDRHLPDADAVVLAAAGSSDPGWLFSITEAASALGNAHVAYVSGSEPKVADVVAGLRRQGARRIAIAAYLLAEGLFYRTLHRAGADSVTPPFALDPAVVSLIVRRYESALLTTGPARM